MSFLHKVVTIDHVEGILEVDLQQTKLRAFMGLD